MDFTIFHLSPSYWKTRKTRMKKINFLITMAYIEIRLELFVLSLELWVLTVLSLVSPPFTFP